MYGAVNESTASSLDTITNFHAGDVIDLRGLGMSLSYDGQVSSHAKNLAADSINWTVQSGNTLISVNTTGSSEALSTPSMMIELIGKPTLTSGNFLHA